MKTDRTKGLAFPCAVASLVIMLVALAGCGSGGKTTKVDYREGGITARSTKTITETELGVPIYPGAKLKTGKAAVTDSSGPEGNWEATEAVLMTGDPVNKVSEWYKANLSSQPGFEDLSTNEGGKELAMYYYLDGEQSRTVVVEKSGDGSNTGITVTLQKKIQK